MIIEKTIINKEQLRPPPSRYGSVAEFLGNPTQKASSTDDFGAGSVEEREQKKLFIPAIALTSGLSFMSRDINITSRASKFEQITKKES
jgi:hypothetical protein